MRSMPVRRFRPFGRFPRRGLFTIAAAGLALVLAGCAPTASTSTSPADSPATPATIASPGTGSMPVPRSTATAGSAATTPSRSGTRAPTVSSSATAAPDPEWAPGTQQLTVEVDGVARHATVEVPKDRSKPAPLVFMFHGHGGNGTNVDRNIDIDCAWPEAIVIYPDGLVGHKGITDPEGVKPGWQTVVGEDGDRDLHLYDALLATAQAKLSVDPERIYVMGHSNGSAFAGLVLNQRGDKIAASANMSAQANRRIKTNPVRSMFMMMGEKDPIVPFANQKQAIPLAEAKLGADPARANVDGYLRIEPGTGHLELATYIHPGGHEVPDAVPALVVAFFQRHTLSGG